MTLVQTHAGDARSAALDHADGTIERMTRVLLEGALQEAVDLGDERSAHAALIRAGFAPHETGPHLLQAIDRARARLQHRAQLLDAGEKFGAAAGLAVWIGLFVVVYLVLCPLSAHAAPVAPATPSVWRELIPVAMAMAVIVGLIRLVLWRTKPLDHDEAESVADASRWNPEGRR